ncbi:hypothetical protein EON78_02950 [bacterium]|nr:MAG: hypothetical protein EON78_02950 [bacterium]
MTVKHIEEESALISGIANNIAWRYSFKDVNIEEIRDAVIDITLSIPDDKFIERVYLEYLDIIKKSIF